MKNLQFREKTKVEIFTIKTFICLFLMKLNSYFTFFKINQNENLQNTLFHGINLFCSGLYQSAG